jgi:hypothetical protein
MSFHDLKNALSEGDTRNLNYLRLRPAFVDGVDLHPSALLERKMALQTLLKNAPHSIQ